MSRGRPKKNLNPIPPLKQESTVSSSETEQVDTKEKLDELGKKYDAENSEQHQKTSTSNYKSKKKIAEENELKAKEFTDSISSLGSTLMNIVVTRLPKPSPLTLMEVEMFDKTFSKVARKYVDKLGQWQEETALVLVAGMILFPRLEFGKKKDSEKDVD